MKIELNKVKALDRGDVESLPPRNNFFNSTKAAFTLIEMILAMGVAALVLVAITTVLFAALHLHDATAEVVDDALPLDQTTIFLRRDLECVVTPTNGTSKVLSGDFKTGNISTPGIAQNVAVEMFTATGALGENAPWGDIQRVTYELKNPENNATRGSDLFRTVTRNLLATSTPDVTDQLMMHGVESVKFSGYNGTQWLDTWDTSDPSSVNTNLPLAVRVEIQLAGSQDSDPIEIIVPVDSMSQTNMVLTTTEDSTGNNGGNETGGGGGNFGGNQRGNSGGVFNQTLSPSPGRAQP